MTFNQLVATLERMVDQASPAGTYIYVVYILFAVVLILLAREIMRYIAARHNLLALVVVVVGTLALMRWLNGGWVVVP
jgi:uncharacterized protein YebE (UPF0316 family)